MEKYFIISDLKYKLKYIFKSYSQKIFSIKKEIAEITF